MENNYFSRAEFACKCERENCDAVPPESDLITKLIKLRLELNKKMIITSGSRCVEHNQKVGGADNSFHLVGKAVDIKTTSALHAGQILRLAIKLNFTGIGISKNGFIHLDTRPSEFVVFGY